MTPSERVNQMVQERLAPLLQSMVAGGAGKHPALPQSQIDSMRIDAILDLMDNTAALQSLSPSRMLERCVEILDQMTTGNRATMLALLGERYKPNGERR